MVEAEFLLELLMRLLTDPSGFDLALIVAASFLRGRQPSSSTAIALVLSSPSQTSAACLPEALPLPVARCEAVPGKDILSAAVCEVK